jgi:hypothetical protein
MVDELVWVWARSDAGLGWLDLKRWGPPRIEEQHGHGEANDCSV